MQADEDGVMLLREILANPRDWFRLLVFSDFLLEQGLPGYLGWRLLAGAKKWPCENLQARKYPWVWWDLRALLPDPEVTHFFCLKPEVWRLLRPPSKRDGQAKYAGVLAALQDLGRVLEQHGPIR